MHWHDLTTTSKSALLVALLGFVLSFTSTGEVTIEGQTACTHMDFAALCLGGLAMALGGVGAVKARDLTAGRALNLWISVAVIAIGFLHLLRGLGLVGGPC